MEPKNAAEGPARVVGKGKGSVFYDILVGETSIMEIMVRPAAEEKAALINRALSPLVAKAQWADAVAECLRYQVSVGIPISPAETSLLVKYAAIGGK